MNKKRKLWELQRLSPEEFMATSKVPITLVLDDIRSFENVGAVFRTADSFAISEIVLCGITPVPPHREIHKTALGATESMPWRYFPTAMEAQEELKRQGHTLLVFEQAEQTTPLHQVTIDAASKVALFFGNEVNGVHQEVVNQCDEVVEIPQFGTKHSLNVSVCVGIAAWHFSRLLNPQLRD